MYAIWLEHFRRNRRQREAIPWERGVSVEPRLREPLIRSLQRFQLGESGDGRHLKRVAATLDDAGYAAAVALFVEEEQEHAALMAGVLQALDAPLLQSHWSDKMFRLLCLAANLRLELMLLVVTEVIAKRYFRAVRHASDDVVLRAVCEQILRDEEAHIAFHCAALQQALAGPPAAARSAARSGWRLFFEAVCAIVSYDHRGLLTAAGLTPRKFRRDCRRLFKQAASRALGEAGRASGRPAAEGARP